MNPKHVYLNEYQVQMQDGITYLPYASGLLAAYAKANLLSGEFEFHINEPILHVPYAVAVSVSLWNRNAGISAAQQIGSQYLKCRFIFGGPSSEEFSHHISGEGEASFLTWLTAPVDHCPIQVSIIKDIDDLPSPYLTGVFDSIVATRRRCQAIIETMRGCPFQCAYCSWGKGEKKIRLHSLNYIKEEAEWMGINKIPYVFCADGNFGMLPRDPEVARIFARVKQKYGYPEKFRVCYGKNAEDTIFETASILAEAGLAKTVTISRQSTNPATLAAIGRQNVSQETFTNLQARYHVAKIPTYTELILGLPEETYQSFADGIQKSIEHFSTQLLIYPCEVLPSTRLAEPEYQVRYGIKVKQTLLTPVHALPLSPREYEDIIIGTKAMPTEDWRKAFVLSRVVQLFYSLKVFDKFPLVPFYERLMDFTNLAQAPILQSIILEFYNIANELIAGQGRCQILPRFGSIYWEPEEAAFLTISEDKHKFYDELRLLFPNLIKTINIQEENFPELEGDPVEFAKQTILYGRKNNMKAIA